MLRSRAALIQRRDEQNREARRVGGRTCSGEALSCSLFAEGSRQGHFFLRFRLNCTRCISIAPAMLDRYLAALPAMSLIPFAPFFTADFLAPLFALLFESPTAPSPALRPLPMSALTAW